MKRPRAFACKPQPATPLKSICVECAANRVHVLRYVNPSRKPCAPVKYNGLRRAAVKCRTCGDFI